MGTKLVHITMKENISSLDGHALHMENNNITKRATNWKTEDQTRVGQPIETLWNMVEKELMKLETTWIASVSGPRTDERAASCSRGSICRQA